MWSYKTNEASSLSKWVSSSNWTITRNTASTFWACSESSSPCRIATLNREILKFIALCLLLRIASLYSHHTTGRDQRPEWSKKRRATKCYHKMSSKQLSRNRLRHSVWPGTGRIPTLLSRLSKTDCRDQAGTSSHSLHRRVYWLLQRNCGVLNLGN